MRKNEFEYILDILNGKNVEPDENFDWYSILGFLELNKISGYFYSCAKSIEAKLPKTIERKLSSILNYQVEKNNLMKRYIQDINEELKFEKIKYAFLKGSVLSHTNFHFTERSFSCMQLSREQRESYKVQANNMFYLSGERISNDIDILVEQKNLSKVAKVLKSMGFVQGEYDFNNNEIIPFSRYEILSRRMNRGETAPFILKTDNMIVPFIEVDVNFSLDYKPESYPGLLTEMLDNCVDYSGDIFGGIRSLSVEDFFLHLVIHQYKESIVYSMVCRNKDAELYKLIDIYLMISRGYVDIERLYTKVKKYKLENEMFLIFHQLTSIFGDVLFGNYEKLFKSNENLVNVIDPVTKKKYFWIQHFNERILTYNKKAFLREVDNE